MAAEVLLLLLLLLKLISYIHAEVTTSAGRSHTFFLDATADFCSVYRWTSEGKELLWSSSASYYQLSRLTVSHSGHYQVQCWTQGNVKLMRNTTLLVCDDQNLQGQSLYLDVGETAELTCDGVRPKQWFQWAYDKPSTAGLVLIDEGSPPEHQHQQVRDKSSLLITAYRPYVPMSYYCLDKQQLTCNLYSRFFVQVPPEVILRSVGESLELNCADGSRNQTLKWGVLDSLWTYRESLNSSLMFPSLTLDHSGRYRCELSVSGEEYYDLYVCPEPELPPAVELFTSGENLTLHCGNWSRTGYIRWLMRSKRSGGRVSHVRYQRPNIRQLYNRSLVIRNTSLQDSGQYWCVVTRGLHCVFRSETLVMFREPEVDHHLLRAVLLSVVMLCVVTIMVVMVWRSRRRQQLPAPVEELEMSQLSPVSDLEEETPV